MRLLMKAMNVIAAGVFLAALLAACNGGPGSSGGLPAERPAGVVSGYAIDGAIAGGVVRVYAFANASKGELLGETSSDVQGFYSIDIQSRDQPVLIEVSGGSYIEQASGVTVPLREEQVLRSVALYESGKPLNRMVTPLTNVAVGLAEYKVSQGVDAVRAIQDSLAAVSAAFGVNVADVRPRDIGDSSAVTASSAENFYGFLLAGISSWTAWAGEQDGDTTHSIYTSIGLGQLLYNDIVADGVLDGVGRNKAGDGSMSLSVGVVPLNRDVYRISFAQHLLAMANSARNATGLSADDFRDSAVALAGNRDPLFRTTVTGGVAVLPVAFPVDPEGFYYNGVVTYRVVIGGSGIAQQVLFDVDGLAIGQAADPTQPSIEIDTRAYADGEHLIGVTANDGIGNEAYRQFAVRFDNTAPFVNVTSAPVTNQADFTITGTFGDNGAGVSAVIVQDKPASLSSGGTWQAQASLAPGNNAIVIRVRDRVGNEFQTQTSVGLDTAAPLINTAAQHSQAALSAGGGTFTVATLQNANDAAPLYIETNRVDLAGVPVTRAGLDGNGIPYFGFVVSDPDSAGVATVAAQLAVRMRYEKNGDTAQAWRPLTALVTGKDYLVPLASEVLGESWLTSRPSDPQAIRVQVEDKAGNHTEALFTFRVDFYTPALTIAQPDDVAQAAFTATAFTQRASLNGATIDANAYTFTNTASRAIYLYLDDGDTHTATQTVEQMVRENLARLETKTQWRAGTVVNALDICPTLDSWKLVNEIFNYSGGTWSPKTSPPATSGDPVSVTSDNPAAPEPTNWQDVPDFDSDFAPLTLSTPPVTLTYQYDYVLNLSAGGQTRPALIRNWTQTDSGSTPGEITCPDIRNFQQRLEYRYKSEGGYPRNMLSTFIEQTGFSSSAYRVIDNGAGSEVTAVQGWYRIPPGHSVTITKRVTLPALTIYNDTDVANSGAFSSYTPHRYDKIIVWAISRHLQITSVHDAGEANVATMSPRDTQAGAALPPAEYQLAR
ncbi:MAG: hypothetical protein FD165_2691 [Gammaproteobacteria bacterium]|nr:MAG: hypothetical protein FD165_2691 [Gammaproteobacteria bacterium]TND01758.1 MAG: hypothetical protein FD120_2522 [Gammaproteobacteria bacterium]